MKMGLLHQTVNYYRTCGEGKRWWWMLKTNMVGMAGVNGWKLYSFVGQKN